MTDHLDPLFRTDAYAREVTARVVSHTEEGGVVLDTALFYPTGGGQPGDSGWIDWDGTSLAIATTDKVKQGAMIFFDFATAFPSISHDWIFIVLEHMHLDDNVISLIRLLYTLVADIQSRFVGGGSWTLK